MKEYKDLTNDEDPSFTAGPVREDDFFEWEALITGPEGTPFVSGSCRVLSGLMFGCLLVLRPLGRRSVRGQADIRKRRCVVSMTLANFELVIPLQPQDYPLNPFKMTFDPPLFHPNGESTL